MRFTPRSARWESMSWLTGRQRKQARQRIGWQGAWQPLLGSSLLLQTAGERQMPGVVFGHLDTAVPETRIAVDSILLLETETILKIIVMDRVILVMFSFL